MLIRLEMHNTHGKSRYGIYQILDPYVLDEVCTTANLLPIPNYNEIKPIKEIFSYWFTLEGWQKYGKGFVDLFYEPYGIEELYNNNSPVYVSIINTETEEKLSVIYQDQWQKALLVSDTEKVTETFEVYNSCDWEKLEHKFPELA